MFQRKRRFAEQFAPPAVQGRDIGVIVGSDLSRSSTVAITLLATACRSDVIRSSTFRSSTMAPPLELPRGFSIFGSVEGSRATPRWTAATMSVPHLERSKPFGSERRLASRSRLVGAWVAISPTASSLRTRLRGRRGFALPVRARPRLPSAPRAPWVCAPASSAAPRRVQDGNRKSWARSGLPSPRSPNRCGRAS